MRFGMTESIKSVRKLMSTSHTINENDIASGDDDCETSCLADIKRFDDYEWKNCFDLTNLPVLSEENLLHCLKERYSVDLIYTQMKNHIISVNPCRPIPEMYSKEKTEKLGKSEAHVFKLGQVAFDSLISKRSLAECIVINGESGSGKTECCRYLLHYLINLSTQNNQMSNQKAQFVEKRLLQANPVLEAFGNAPTCHNRNSSRFGKYIQLLYHPATGVLLGGRIQIYLLEKTRILHLRSNRADPFHVFHAMSTMSADERTRFHLETEFPWCQVTPFITWDNLMESMIALGIGSENIRRITAILSALVLLSQLNFEMAPINNKRNHHAESSLILGEENHPRLSRIAELLGTQAKLLIASLTQHKFSSRRESVYIRPCTLEEAMSRVDTLMKLIYQLLFECIIKEANSNICSVADRHLIDDSKEACYLGLLDMYGFECLQTNTLEQLCINYANEKLQRYFIESILLATKLEYEQEEVPFHCGSLNSISEGEAATFLERHIFTILEEECRMQRQGTTAARLATRLRNEVQPQFPSVLTRLTPCDGLKVEMCVRHYAGQVNYDLSDFLEQNADRVPADIFNLLMESSQGQWLLRGQSKCSLSTFVNGYKRRPAVCTQFRDAVASLLRRLDASSEVHFVRCVKPFADAGLGLNSHTQQRFDVNFVRHQLHSSGVMDTIRVCRAAIHPVRIKYEEFHRRYICLFSSRMKQRQDYATSTTVTVDSPSVYVDLEKRFREQHRLPSTPPRSSTRSVRRRTGASQMDQQRRVCAAISHVCLTSGNGIQADQFGRQLIFLTKEQSDSLEATRLALHHHAACILQSSVRSWLTRLFFLRIRSATIKIQRFVRRCLLIRRQRHLYIEDVRNRSACVIQHWVRRWLVVKRHKSKRAEDDALIVSAIEKKLLVQEESKPRSPIKMFLSPISNTRKYEELTKDSCQYLHPNEKNEKDHHIVDEKFSSASDIVNNHSNKKLSADNFYRENGILSCRFIPKSQKGPFSTDYSRRHRLLPYSNVRPLYHGCPVISSYRISITNCL